MTKVVALDAVGTMFDVGGVAAECESVFPGHGEALAVLWRERQLRYAWLRALMGSYLDFDRVTQDALVASCLTLGLDPHGDSARELAGAFERLPLYPDVRGALQALFRSGLRPVVLSNATPALLQALVRRHGLEGMGMELLSADAVRTYKPDPRVYRLVTERFRVAPGEVVFVSSNAWDVAGALSFGFRCAWINRQGAPYEVLGSPPEWTVASMEELVARIAPTA